MMDVACMFAAGCDLAIADPAAVSDSGTPILPTLLKIYQQAHQDFSHEEYPAKTEGMLAIMDIQFSRLLSATTQVQSAPHGEYLGPLLLWVTVGLQSHIHDP